MRRALIFSLVLAGLAPAHAGSFQDYLDRKYEILRQQAETAAKQAETAAKQAETAARAQRAPPVQVQVQEQVQDPCAFKGPLVPRIGETMAHFAARQKCGGQQ
jgi:hypothetical protein